MDIQQVKITFEELALSAIARSEKGIVALVLKDDTIGDVITKYALGDSVTNEPWTADNQKYINYAFKGNPKEVVCVRVASSGNFSDAIASLKTFDFDYVAMPEGATQDQTDMSNFVKGVDARNNGKKAVCADTTADSEAVINVTTQGIKFGDDVCTTAAFTARVAGVAAGLPMTSSIDGYVFTDVTEFTESSDPDADVAAGKFILAYVNNKVRPAAENNSLTTLTQTKKEAFQSIKGMETMDLIQKDVYDTYVDQWQAIYGNSYTMNLSWHQVLTGYLEGLQRIGALDPDQPVSAGFNVVAKEAYLKSIGTDTSGMTIAQIERAPSRRKVFTAVSGVLGWTMGELDFVMTVL